MKFRMFLFALIILVVATALTSCNLHNKLSFDYNAGFIPNRTNDKPRGDYNVTLLYKNTNCTSVCNRLVNGSYNCTEGICRTPQGILSIENLKITFKVGNNITYTRQFINNYKVEIIDNIPKNKYKPYTRFNCNHTIEGLKC